MDSSKDDLLNFSETLNQAMITNISSPRGLLMPVTQLFNSSELSY
jgi:hypothetical protein